MKADALLAVWREACRYGDIGEAAERVARFVAQHVPVEMLVLRQLDLEHARIVTVAVGRAREDAVPSTRPAGRTSCDADVMRRVLAWCAADAPLVSGDASPIAPVLVGSLAERAYVVSPLLRDDGPLGIVHAVCRQGASPTREHVRFLHAMREPFSVALANHVREHDLARLQEAAQAENRALLARLNRQDVVGTIVGADAGLRAIMERVEQVAPTDAPVLLLGETGTGKEVIARSIHAKSKRASGPVVRVNCGALPPGLIDSELFGHERGSFTGAVQARKGWFERADSGTLFLDEIGELPLDAQVRLLRILQDGTLERVGGQRPATVDVRIVAATHRDLHAMVARREFREDLWYRISVFPIWLPPLRERKEDIPALAAHFAWSAGTRLGGVPLSLGQAEVAALLDYAWPGNVRELAAVIERAAILGGGRTLDVAGALGQPRAAERPREPEARVGARAEPPAAASLDMAMKQHIERALATSLGRVEGPFGAAAALGINPQTLRARMRKLGIDWKRYRSKSPAPPA